MQCKVMDGVSFITMPLRSNEVVCCVFDTGRIDEQKAKDILNYVKEQFPDNKVLGFCEGVELKPLPTV